jgi:hypothetical protein
MKRFLIAVLFALPVHASSVDTLDVHTILNRRTAWLDSLLAPESTRLDTVGTTSLADSLDRGGAAAIRAHRPLTTVHAPLRLRTSVRPLALTTYNRVDGLRLGSGVGLRLPGLAHAQADVAYGLARERWEGAALVSLHPLGAGPVERRPALEFGWSDRIVPFGPNQGAHFTSFAALVAGQDRQDYLQRRSVDVRAVVRCGRMLQAGLGGFVRDDWSAARATDFAFAGGGTPIEAANPTIDTGRTRGIFVEMERTMRRNRLGGRLEAGVAGGGLGGDFEYSWQHAELSVAPRLRDGSIVRATLSGSNTAGSPPVQALPYLGGDGNLRGYERLEFAGRRRMAARLDFEWGRDLLAQTGIPLLRRLHLQFIPHVDAGTTWGDARGVAGSRPSLDGAFRSAVGIGIRRLTGYPGIASVRADFTWRTDGEDDGPAIWFRVGDFDFGDD